MARTILHEVKLRLTFETTELKPNGVYANRTKTISKLNPGVTPERLFAFAEAYGSLCSLPMLNIERLDQSYVENV